MMNNEDSAFVLYVDHQGHPAPLSLSYHAMASRRLTSSVDRHPPSSITEIDSAYCPQCLSFYDANTAGNLGYCPNPTCRLCPTCWAVASVAVDNSIAFYNCGLCDWTSKTCQLQVSISDSTNDGEVSSETVEKASEELLSIWKEKKEKSITMAEEHFSNMAKTMAGRAKDHVKGQRSSNRRAFSTALASKRNQDDGLESWSIQTLENKQHMREKTIESSINQPIGGKSLKQISLDEGDEVKPLFSPSLEGLSAETLLCQDVGENTDGSIETLLPLLIPLRPRKSRRCRAELAESRPGILVKPKLNPLEGDSSLRTGHGQWWKKVSYISLFG